MLDGSMSAPIPSEMYVSFVGQNQVDRVHGAWFDALYGF
jgi:hypothetical protein